MREQKKNQVANIFNIDNSDEEKMYEEAIHTFISILDHTDLLMVNPTSNFKAYWEAYGLFMIIY